MYLQSIKSVKQNAVKSVTGQLKEKPTYRVWCLYSSFVHGVNLAGAAGCADLGGI
jgi:hypothetical protein